MSKLAPIALLAALLQNAGAQRMGAAPHFGPHFGSQRSAFGSRSFAYPIPFFSDDLYSDSVFYPGYTAAPQPTVIVLQSPPPTDSAPDRVQPPAEPLLIELQNDRYVRIGGEETSGAQTIDRDSVSSNQPDAGASAAATVHSTPAVLLFQDGHREEVSDYTIANGVLYAPRNYYTNGSSLQRIDLTSLNLPETISANHSRGLRFQLPRSPNEVIVGP
jgi:hypothetical protein